MAGSGTRQKWYGKMKARVGGKGLPKPLNDARGLGVVHDQTKSAFVSVLVPDLVLRLLFAATVKLLLECVLFNFKNIASLLAGTGGFVIHAAAMM